MGQLEGVFWRNTVKPKFDAQPNMIVYRIETRTMRGFPDTICLASGRTSLLELKSKPCFEKALGTTAKQRDVLSKWQRHGGSSYLLAKCGEAVLLLDGETAGEVRDFGWYKAHALLYAESTGAFDWQRLMKELAHGGLRTQAGAP